MSVLTKEEKKNNNKLVAIAFVCIFAAFVLELFEMDSILLLISALAVGFGFPILHLQLLTLKELRKRGN